MTPTLLAQDTAGSQGMSLLDYISAGHEIGFFIILLSLLALGLIITNLIQIRLSRLAPPLTVEKLDHLFKTNDMDGVVTLCNDEDSRSFLTRTLGNAMARCMRSPFGFLEIKSALEESGQQQVARLYRQTEWIGIIASIAPMLGLLGTVVGILVALDALRASEGVPRPDELAGGISLALVTTVMGLLVAIPCTFAFAYLRNRIDELADQVANVLEELTAHLEGAGSGASKPPPPPQRPRPAAPPQGAPTA